MSLGLTMTASARVFAVVEILEAILLGLDEEILRAELVNKHWRNVIRTSTGIGVFAAAKGQCIGKALDVNGAQIHAKMQPLLRKFKPEQLVVQDYLESVEYQLVQPRINSMQVDDCEADPPKKHYRTVALACRAPSSLGINIKICPYLNEKKLEVPTGSWTHVQVTRPPTRRLVLFCVHSTDFAALEEDLLERNTRGSGNDLGLYTITIFLLERSNRMRFMFHGWEIINENGITLGDVWQVMSILRPMGLTEAWRHLDERKYISRSKTSAYLLDFCWLIPQEETTLPNPAGHDAFAVYKHPRTHCQHMIPLNDQINVDDWRRIIASQRRERCCES